MANTTTPQTLPAQRENPWLNFGCNLILPFLILTQGGKYFPAVPAAIILIVAISFPSGYFIYDWKVRKKSNVISIIGMVSVLLTGGIGLLKLSAFVFAIKETAMPLVIGLITLVTAFTKRPLIKEFLLNPGFIYIEKIENALNTEEKRHAFDKLIITCTWIFSSTFVISAIVNYFVTRMVVTADPTVNEQLFNEQIGKQTVITFIIIAVMQLPAAIITMLKLFGGIEKLTGLDLEQITVSTKAVAQKTEQCVDEANPKPKI